MLNSDFLRREWGAVSFLVVTALGIIAVPVGLSLNRHAVAPAAAQLVVAPCVTPAPVAAVSPGPSGSPLATPSPVLVACPSPTATPAASPSPVTPSPSPTAAPPPTSPSPAETPSPSPS